MRRMLVILVVIHLQGIVVEGRSILKVVNMYHWRLCVMRFHEEKIIDQDCMVRLKRQALYLLLSKCTEASIEIDTLNRRI